MEVSETDKAIYREAASLLVGHLGKRQDDSGLSFWPIRPGEIRYIAEMRVAGRLTSSSAKMVIDEIYDKRAPAIVRGAERLIEVGVLSKPVDMKLFMDFIGIVWDYPPSETPRLNELLASALINAINERGGA